MDVLVYSQWWHQCRHSGRGCISWPTAWMYIWSMCHSISRYHHLVYSAGQCHYIVNIIPKFCYWQDGSQHSICFYSVANFSFFALLTSQTMRSGTGPIRIQSPLSLWVVDVHLYENISLNHYMMPRKAVKFMQVVPKSTCQWHQLW